jgi:hypothetical protein
MELLMRVFVGVCAAFSLVGLAQTVAAETPPAATDSKGQQVISPAQSTPAPSTVPPTPTAPAPAAAPEAAAVTPSAASTIASAQTPSSKVTITGSKDLTPQEKNLISSGYTLQTHGDKKLFCKKETTLGSRFPHTTCQTSDQIFAQIQHSKDVTGEIQRGYAPPPK